MTNNRQFSISRRKVLAGLGTIGVASAGAGLGTTAYFSDQETFQNNQLTAGTLDMKVDWEEHYSDWSDDEAAFASMGSVEEFDIVLPAAGANGTLIPDARPIYLKLDGETAGEKQASKDGLWDTTSVEAFPDVLSGDSYDGIQDEFSDAEACGILTDVGGNSTGLSDSRRTRGTFAGQTTEEGDPLINIEDVKPGDFGEVTFSFHLCDNPGYVWLNGDLVSAAENGHTEPEGEDPDSAGPTDEVSGPEDLATSQVELLDEMVTRIWYDPNGNNQVDLLSGELDIMLAIDASGSIEGSKNTVGTEAHNLVQGVDTFVAALAASPADIQLGQVLFGENSSLTRFTGLTTPGTVPDMATEYPNSGRGNTPLPAALDVCDQELRGPNGRASADKIVVAFTDGGPNYSEDTYTAGGYTAPRAAGVGYSEDDNSGNGYDNSNTSGVTVGEEEETAKVAETIRDAGTRIVVVNVADDPTEDQGSTGATLAEYLSGSGTPYPEGGIASSSFYFEVDLADFQAVADDLAASVAVAEEVFFQGTLREALTLMSGNDGRGIPLDGDVSTAFDEVNDPENDEDRDCFAGEGTTHYVGFQWWLPIDHANQIQSDSVSFDVGFYTEQCRHNDGGGMIPEEAAEVEQTPEAPQQPV